VTTATVGLESTFAAYVTAGVTARAEIVFDAAGRVAAVRHIWQFDEAFSAYAMQGYDANNDGRLDLLLCRFAAPNLLYLNQGDGTFREAGKGSGLGLSIVLGIVRQHRGWVEVDSQPGQGSEFRLHFPSSEQQVEQLETISGLSAEEAKKKAEEKKAKAEEAKKKKEEEKKAKKDDKKDEKKDEKK
jgi:hypothetical protein